MAKIMGNIVGLPSPRSDWNQTDETKADFIKNKPDIDALEKKIGDIDAALEELHNYAQALIGGAE